MYKLVILIEQQDDLLSYENLWPDFLAAAERMPGLLRETASPVQARIFGTVEIAAIHEFFFADLGASRAILPRQTRVEEAVAMATAVPEMEIEVFILNDGCIYEEGHCSTLHRAGPICLTDWSYTFRSSGSNPPLTADEIEDRKV